MPRPPLRPLKPIRNLKNDHVQLTARRSAVEKLPERVRLALPASALDVNRPGSLDQLLRELHTYKTTTGDAKPLVTTLRILAPGADPRLQWTTRATLLDLQAEISGMRKLSAPALASQELQSFTTGGAPTTFDQMLPATYLTKGAQAMRSVARITVTRHQAGAAVMKGTAPWTYSGTAWLLTPRHVITNHHVLHGRDEGEALLPGDSEDFARQWQTASLELDFDSESAVATPLAIASLGPWSDLTELDFAVLELASEVTDRPPLTLARSAPFVPPGSADAPAANVVQHPWGGPKLVGLRNNLIATSGSGNLWYFTDTEAGSSGSPVFDDRWRVVGLHRAAGISPQLGTVNLGTPIHLILAQLSTPGSLVGPLNLDP